MNDVANKIMDAIQDIQILNGNMPDSRSVDFCFKNCADHIHLRRYMVLMVLFKTTFKPGSDIETYRTSYKELASTTPDFASDFVELQFTYGVRLGRGNIDPRKREPIEKSLGRCFFHTHRKGEVCHLDNQQKDKTPTTAT